MRNGDDMTDPDRKQQAAPPRLRSVVRAMIWATVPVLLLVQLLASAGAEASSFWSQIRQLDARIARVAESRAELIAANIFIGKPLAAMMSAIQRSKQDGRAYPAEVKSSNEFGQLAHAFNAMQHTTSGALDRLGHMAAHDPLTGLPNRRSLSEHLV